MPDVIHTIAARLRRFVGNRRQVLRHRTSLPLRLRILDGKGGDADSAPSLRTKTREISETSLTFIASFIDLSNVPLDKPGLTLQTVLELPLRPVEMHVETVRYEQFRKGSYLIGARITSMSDGDRFRYIAYLRRLSMKVHRWHV